MAIHLQPVGISALDEQHRAMGDMLRAFRLAAGNGRPSNELREMIETAMAALRAHCRHEEALMANSAFADAPAHRLDHERLMLAATAFTEDVLHHRLAADVLHENGDLLRDLFVAHMNRFDRDLAQHLISLGMG
jgi:hemerythrin-like metal-binding protein